VAESDGEHEGDDGKVILPGVRVVVRMFHKGDREHPAEIQRTFQNKNKVAQV
jgi:hypothetical protein